MPYFAREPRWIFLGIEIGKKPGEPIPVSSCKVTERVVDGHGYRDETSLTVSGEGTVRINTLRGDKYSVTNIGRTVRGKEAERDSATREHLVYR